MAEATAAIVESPAMANVLKKRRGKSIVSHAFEKLSTLSEKPQCCSRVRQRPTQVIGPASAFAGSMKMLSSRCGSTSAHACVRPSAAGTS